MAVSVAENWPDCGLAYRHSHCWHRRVRALLLLLRGGSRGSEIFANRVRGSVGLRAVPRRVGRSASGARARRRRVSRPRPCRCRRRFLWRLLRVLSLVLLGALQPLLVSVVLPALSMVRLRLSVLSAELRANRGVAARSQGVRRRLLR